MIAVWQRLGKKVFYTGYPWYLLMLTNDIEFLTATVTASVVARMRSSRLLEFTLKVA